MTSIVKQRIEQIRRGEVPEGYKKTKVGVVPCKWEETRFKKMFSRLSRKNKENNDNVLTISAQYGLISQRDFFNKDIASDDKSNYFLLHNGEFAYNKSYSNGYPFGALKRLDLYDKGIVSPLYICFSANESNKCPDFYVHYFEAGMMNREIQAFAQEGARNHGLLNISVDDFFNSYLLMPPLPEQEKIAGILSAQDKLIALKEKLIEEKKRQKKALMQQLLTGKKRLPGFKNVWQRKKVSDFATLCTDSIDPCKCSKEKFEVYSLPSYDNKKTPEYLQGSEMNSNKFLVAEGMVLFNKLNVRQKRVWYIDRTSNTRMLSSTEFLPMIVKGINPKFLAQYLLTDSATQYFKLRSSGTSNSQQRIQPNDLMKHSFLVPAVDEQNKIVDVLETFDDEMVLLEKELDQEKQKKKALMQLLLTGIVRV